jgi:hypothetical protein
MSFEQPDNLYFEGQRYATVAHPLAAYFETAGRSTLFAPVSPDLQRGYWASWVIDGGQLYLADIRGALQGAPDCTDNLLHQVFAGVEGNVLASWYTGTLHGLRGRLRHLGVPPAPVYDHEIVLRIVAGKVQASSFIDHSGLPDPTDAELRQTLPRFLWPTRLRKPDQES